MSKDKHQGKHLGEHLVSFVLVTLYLYCKAMDNYEFYISGDLFYVFPWAKMI